jgi:PmbA protein
LVDLIERAGKCAAGKIADISEIILSPEASSLLFSTLLCPALCADNMIQNQSFLRGHEGKRVASEELTVKDDATLAGGLVSRSFDAEGTPSRCVPLVEGGRLTGFLHDLTTAQLSKKKSTGNAFRDYRNEPIVFPSNVVIEYEDSIPLNRLIEETDRGVMARGIIGAYSSDYISGDFSVTLDECSLIENGDVKRIENLSIGGNIFEFLTSIECVSKEIVQSGHFVIPWIKISKE